MTPYLRLPGSDHRPGTTIGIFGSRRFRQSDDRSISGAAGGGAPGRGRRAGRALSVDQRLRGYEFFQKGLNSTADPKWIVGVGARWQLFDGFARQNRLQAARHLEEAIGFEHDHAQHEVGTLVQQRYDEYQSALEQYQSLETTLALAQESLSSEQKAYAAGVGTSLDVVDAQLALSRAQVDRLTAVYDLDLAVARLLEASGQSGRSSWSTWTGQRPRRSYDDSFPCLGILLLAACRRDSVMLQGETDAKQVSVAAKVSGRVDSLYVQEGDSVRRGEIVATLDGPEIRAKAAQAMAARDAARAIHDKALHGSREEDIRAARDNWLRAVASATIAETTYARLDRLQREGVVPTQKRDEAEAALRTQPRGSGGGEGPVRPGDGGRRSEDRAAALADLRRAEGRSRRPRAT